MEEKDVKSIRKRHKADKHDRHGRQTSEEENKQDNKQKVVCVRDKCRFGLNVHNFIVLKHG